MTETRFPQKIVRDLDVGGHKTPETYLITKTESNKALVFLQQPSTNN